MYKIFLAIRYLRKRRITYFAVLSVALCVAMVLGVHSVMGSFVETVRNSARKMLGDLIVEAGSMTTFPLYDEFIAELHNVFGDELIVATPVLNNAGYVTMQLAEDDHRAFPVTVSGIRLQDYVNANQFSTGLYYNTWYPGTTTLESVRKPRSGVNAAGVAQLPDDLETALSAIIGNSELEISKRFERIAGQPFPGPGVFKPHSSGEAQYSGEAYPGAILGVGIVSRRQTDGAYVRDVPRGTLVRLTVLPPGRTGTAVTSMGHSEYLRYIDDSHTQIHEFDTGSLFCGLEFLQKLLEVSGRRDESGVMMPSRVNQIQIKLADGVDVDLARDKVETLWVRFSEANIKRLSDRDLYIMNRVGILTWQQRNSRFIKIVEKQHLLVLILFGVISLVAVVLVGSTFFMIAQEKTREIGIIKSVGASARGVAGIFISYAFGVGAVGSGLGVVIGTFFVKYINEIQAGLARLHPNLQMWSPEVYSFERIPNDVQVFDALVVMVVAIFAAVIGSTVAAWRAARVWPVAALRYE